MLLSDESILGLRMTGKYNINDNKIRNKNLRIIFDIITHIALSFIGLVEFLFSRPEIKDKRVAFLSNNICQDSLEQFFGCQRQRRGTSDNPNVKKFVKTPKH